MTNTRPVKRYDPVSIRRWSGAAALFLAMNLLLFIAIGVLGSQFGMQSSHPAAMAMSIAVILSALLGFLAFNIVLFNAWDQLRDRDGIMHPGLAVGLNFIPLFNIIWLFFSYAELAKKTNLYMDELGIEGPRAPYGRCLTACILFATVIIPLLGILTGLIGYVFLLVSFLGLAKATAAIGASEDEEGAPAPARAAVFDEPERI